jgi:hypothetical protein
MIASNSGRRTRTFILFLAFSFSIGVMDDRALGSKSGRSDGPATISAKSKKTHAKRFVSAAGVFRVWLSAYQTVRWSHFSSSDECSGSSSGHGFEKMYLRVPRRKMKLSAFGENRLEAMILPQLKSRGWVKRQGKYEYTPNPAPAPDCEFADGGGDYVPPKPDCGRKSFKGLPVSMVALDGYFSLESRDPPSSNGFRYRNCPRLSLTGWPKLLDKKTNGKPVQSKFPGRLIFNPKFNRKTGAWSRVTIIGKGTRKYRTMTGSSQIRIEWTLNLKRLR